MLNTRGGGITYSILSIFSLFYEYSNLEYVHFRVKGALQLLINRYGQIRFAQVPERVSTQSFVVLIIGNSKSFHLGAQGTFNPNPIPNGVSF